MKLILSISGGGIRGLIPAMILAEIERRANKPISPSMNLIAGTSTGGIIACLLAMTNLRNQPRYTASRIVELYRQFGKQAFKRSFWRKLYTLDGLIGTKYQTEPLEALLFDYFGWTKLSDIKTNLLIPTYQISNIPFPYFFKTHHATNPQSAIDNPFLWQCARATTAANGYFKPYKFDSNHTFLDGGVFANNPAMCAYTQAKNAFPDENLTIISIGTGEDLIGYSYDKIKSWGMAQWALPFFKQTSISADATIDHMLSTFTKSDDNYFRLQASLSEQTLRMDDVSDENLLRLEQAANHLIAVNTDIIDQIVKLL